MMLEDDEAAVPYRIGEVFVHLTQEEVQERLDRDKSKVISLSSPFTGCRVLVADEVLS